MGIQKFDQEHAPYGLYALPELLQNGRKGFSPLARILAGDRLGPVELPGMNLFDRLGWRGRATGTSLAFTVPTSVHAEVEIETHASTKVRRYGNSYHLDKVHGKDRPEATSRVEDWVAKLPKSARERYSPEFLERLGAFASPRCANPSFRGALLVAYVPRQSDFQAVVGKATNVQFVSRYELTFHRLEWQDVHQREFWVGLFFWTYRPSLDG